MQNFIKTILNGVQTWTKGKIKESITASTADWNQNDYNADNYVKNRTHWEEGIIKTIALSGTYSGAWNWIQHDTSSLSSVWVEGSEILVNWNGIEYNLTVRWDSAMGYDGVGNFSCYYPGSEDTGEPFAIYVDGFGNTDNTGIIVAVKEENVEATLEISFIDTIVHKLDSKYLDLPTNLATTDDVQDAVDLASEAHDAVSSKMDANNPVGTGSFSMNRTSSSVVGVNSIAMGTGSRAVGRDSIAIGKDAMADTMYSFAIGDTSYTSGQYGVSIGRLATAIGISSVAIGNSAKTTGDYSCAIGRHVIASGEKSLAIGCANIEDTSNKYAHIVGNGTPSARSNAHTLDWNGVGWYQGGLQVGGNAQDDGAKNVLLEGDAVKLGDIEFTLPASAPSDWYSITYGNGKFVAISSSSSACYSEDGITWTKTTLPISAARKVAYGNGKFVAVAYNCDKAAYSEDGINWTETTLPQVADWGVVTYGNGKFVAVVCNNSRIAAYSENGINWTETKLGIAYPWQDITYGNGKFVIGSLVGQMAYSEDGITWTHKTKVYLKSITYGNGKFVGISGSSSACYSEDGITWTKTTLPISADWKAVTYGDGKFVAVSNGTNAVYSEDGITWTQTILSISSNWRTVTYGNGKFVAVASPDNKVAYSEDGIRWHNAYEALVQDNEDVTGKVRDLILPISSAASVGQTIAVKSVDENGKPVEWETTDISTSGGSGCVVSDTAPEDTSVLWIDTSDNSSDENLGGGNGDLGVTGATVGQTVKISAVDENGVPTAWESVDFPSGGGGGVYELLEKIVLKEEVTTISKDFTAHNLKDLYIVITLNTARTLAEQYTLLEMNYGDIKLRAFRINEPTNPKIGQQRLKTVRTYNSISVAISGITTNFGNLTTENEFREGQGQIFVHPTDVITTISLTKEDKFLSGDIIEIYGVKS